MQIEEKGWCVCTGLFLFVLNILRRINVNVNIGIRFLAYSKIKDKII
ncbi:MAG: hypothetical protein PUK57_00650 [Peptoniphilaceae bacterium]|jgi:hypothetical protein|nr:hypothetical protein [Peptoniphilaceae bacterium]